MAIDEAAERTTSGIWQPRKAKANRMPETDGRLASRREIGWWARRDTRTEEAHGFEGASAILSL